MSKTSFSRMALAVVLLAIPFLAGCEGEIRDAVQDGFYGWLSTTTATLLNSIVPIP